MTTPDPDRVYEAAVKLTACASTVTTSGGRVPVVIHWNPPGQNLVHLSMWIRLYQGFAMSTDEVLAMQPDVLRQKIQDAVDQFQSRVGEALPEARTPGSPTK